MTHHARLLLLLVGLPLAAGPPPSYAQWPINGAPLCVAAGARSNPTIASDGAGGAIVTWTDGRSGDFTISDIYAQRVLASGVVDPAWPVDGRALCTAADRQWVPAIVSDGAGGAIVTWGDFRSAISDEDIYAQHVLASGVVDPAWPVDGRALSKAPNRQLLPQIVADGAGGAIVTWNDLRNGDPAIPDIYAQHVLASGVVDPAWPVGGRALCTAAADKGMPQMVSDGAGGAIVTWHDLRSGDADIYAQRVLATGAVDPAWPVDGRVLCAVPITGQGNPTIVSDGGAGAIVTWEDSRNGSNADVYAQRVLASGVVDPAWPVNGRALSAAVSAKYDPAIVTDGAGGAIVTWLDNTTGTPDIYAQHVSASGVVDPAWPANGRALVIAEGNQGQVAVVNDGAGGAIATWVDTHDVQNTDLFVQRVLASGIVDPAWPPNGTVLCNTNNQQDPQIVTDGAGGAIVTWLDFRSGRNIYAQRVFAGGVVALSPGGVAQLRVRAPHPNPARAGATISFDLPAAQRVSLRVYDVSGQLVRIVAAEREFPAGSQNLVWDGMSDHGTPAGPGVYFVRVTAGGVSVARRLAILQ